MWGLPLRRARTHTRTLGLLLACTVADPVVPFGLYVNNGGCIILKAPVHAFSPAYHLCERGSEREGGGRGGCEICDVSVRKWRNSSSGHVPTRATDGRAHLLVRDVQSWRGENQSKELETEEKK